MLTANFAQQGGPSVRKMVFIVDDHPLLRQGLALLINQQQDLEVCGEAEEAHETMRAIALKRPDILIADISLTGLDGLDLLKCIRATYVDLPVLILSMHNEGIYAERALRARANGYIMKQEATEKVLVAVRRILRGEVYLSNRMSNMMLRLFIRGAPDGIQSQLSALSDRELEVFSLIGDGRGTREIAEELHLSMKTIESYQAHIKEKLYLCGGRELIQHAIHWKIDGKPS